MGAKKYVKGELYKCVDDDDHMMHLPRDPEDAKMRSFRVPLSAFREVQDVQRRLRKLCGGRKQDIHGIAEALLVCASRQPGIEEQVRTYLVNALSTSTEAGPLETAATESGGG